MHDFADLKAGMTVDAALEAFRDGCNQGPDRLFVTDSWFAPREQRLRAHLPDPLTAEAAGALREVVLKVRDIDTVIDWLENGAKPWPEYDACRADETRRQAIARMREGYFPWEDVDACRKRRSQGDRPVEEAQPCPECQTPGSGLTWINFTSPPWTWKHLCGRQGWLTVCDRCRLQVQFFLEVMN